MSNNLLKEAIADAKAIRETALANAKMALEEAFTPKLQSMLSAKIQNEIEGEEGQEEIPVEEPSFDAAPAPEAPVDAAPVDAAPVAPAPDPSFDGGEAPVEAPVDAPVGDEESFDDETDMFESTKEVTSDADNNPEKAKGYKGKPMGLPVAKTTQLKETDDNDEDDKEEVDESNLDIASILRELEAEAGEDVEPDQDSDDFMGESTKEVTSDADNNPEKSTGYKSKPMGLPVAKTQQLKEDEFNLEIEPSGEEGQEGGEESVDEMGNPVPGMGEEEIDIDEILRELGQMPNGEEQQPVAQEQPMFESKKLANENKQLKSKLDDTTKALKEYKSVVTFLKGKLNEINLLNAKLLFTNKLFKAHGLNNMQKMKVIENFDRAKTIREVKLVFATISESLSQTNLVIKTPVVKKITEGLASKATKATVVAKAVVKPKEVISEGLVSADGATRLRKLAGINK